MSLSSKEIAYLDMLACDMIKNGVLPNEETAMKHMQDSNDRRLKFSQEIILQNTRRSRMVKKALCLPVFVELNTIRFKNKLISTCQQLDK